MNKPKITEGEWEYYESSAGVPTVRLVQTLTDISQMCYSSQSNELRQAYGEVEANARAISAVPKMIDALIGVLRLKDLWLPRAEEVNPEHFGEEEALLKMGRKIESALTKAGVKMEETA